MQLPPQKLYKAGLEPAKLIWADAPGACVVRIRILFANFLMPLHGQDDAYQQHSMHIAGADHKFWIPHEQSVDIYKGDDVDFPTAFEVVEDPVQVLLGKEASRVCALFQMYEDAVDHRPDLTVCIFLRLRRAMHGGSLHQVDSHLPELPPAILSRPPTHPFSETLCRGLLAPR